MVASMERFRGRDETRRFAATRKGIREIGPDRHAAVPPRRALRLLASLGSLWSRGWRDLRRRETLGHEEEGEWGMAIVMERD
jgi:hypothetical protein